MTEEELIELVIQERINLALLEVDKSHSKSNKENQKLLEAEKIIDNLANSERELIENYISNFVSNMALKEIYLYKQGFIDGVKTTKTLINL